MLIVFDERSMLSVNENVDLHKGFLREFINETNCSGVIADVYRARDLEDIDISQYKLIVFAYNLFMDDKTRQIVKSVSEDKMIVFNYTAGIHSEDGFSYENFEELTHHKITEIKSEGVQYDFPEINVEKMSGKNMVVLNNPYLRANEIRELAKSAGCHVYTDTPDVTIYADNRFVGVFNKNAGGHLYLREKSDYRDLISGIVFRNTSDIALPKKNKSALFLIKEN